MDVRSDVPESVGNFYTNSRKVQELVGRLPDGTYIWGGPYTIPQAVAGIATFVITFGARQLGLWGWNWISDFIIILVLSAAMVYVVGFIPVPKRSVLGVVSGAGKVLFAPRTGRWQGRPLARQMRHLGTARRTRRTEVARQRRADRRRTAHPLLRALPGTAAGRAGAQKDIKDISCGLDRLLAAETATDA